MSEFVDRLYSASRGSESLVCVGLDPDLMPVSEWETMKMPTSTYPRSEVWVCSLPS